MMDHPALSFLSYHNFLRPDKNSASPENSGELYCCYSWTNSQLPFYNKSYYNFPRQYSIPQQRWEQKEAQDSFINHCKDSRAEKEGVE